MRAEKLLKRCQSIIMYLCVFTYVYMMDAKPFGTVFQRFPSSNLVLDTVKAVCISMKPLTAVSNGLLVATWCWKPLRAVSRPTIILQIGEGGLLLPFP
jgi:hypothetical protein